ncbi:MAG: MBOAT family protein [Prevotella sp.]|nr:MBOAT family protein [Prevotella sp.]
MSFDTTSFLFLFLPAVLTLYFAVEIAGRLMARNSAHGVAAVVNPLLPVQNVVLLTASLFFYAWGEPVHVLLLLAASMVAWGGGMLMSRWRGTRAGKTVMAVTVALLLLSLAVFKYLGFLTDTLNSVPCIDIPVVEMRLPIGISFYTFQILSYVIDLQRGQVGVQRNPLRLLLYVSLFPQLIAGPIVRYQTVERELTRRSFSVDDVYNGTLRFIRGLAKKVIIADNVARFSDGVYDIYAQSMAGADVYDSVGTTALWLASLAYTMQIYFDFSGYSDMAIGLGRILGFHFLENFNFPYVSHSITEFWRRWHISLSGWFRDYVYIPLGGNRRGLRRQLVNIMTVWALTGLWHGASWNFVLWGMYYGVLLIVEKSLKLGERKSAGFSLHRWFLTFVIVDLGWVLFHITDFNDLGLVLQRMFWWHPTDWLRMMAENSDTLLTLPYIPLALVFCFPLFAPIVTSRRPVVRFLRPALALAALALCYVYIISSSFHPFIYFRF